MVEATIVVVTTIGIDLINSPIIPTDSSKGTNPQIVVIAEDQSGVQKSLQTKIPV